MDVNTAAKNEKKLVADFIKWLDGRMAEESSAQGELFADSREDEAVFRKISGNVYGIFRTVADVAGKNCTDDTAAGEFLRARIRQIPANWEASYELAKDHGDEEKMHTERIKLEAMAEVKAMFCELWEVEI